jgi:hypothetical protein
MTLIRRARRRRATARGQRRSHRDEPDVDERIAAQQRRQAPGVGADDEVQVGRALHQPLAVMLRRNRRARSAPRAGLLVHQVAQPADDALLGVLADGAGVDQDDVRPGRIGGALVAVAPR